MANFTQNGMITEEVQMPEGKVKMSQRSVKALNIKSKE